MTTLISRAARSVPLDRGLRVIVATDRSPSADRALTLAGSLSWPVGTTLHVVEVLHDPTVLHGVLPEDAFATQLSEELTHLREAAAAVAGGCAVEHAVLRGRAASELIAHAQRVRADLIVVGSRGRGAISSMLLGSVAAEVVDHAPCPVLVVRTSAIAHVLLADDGSRTARAAVRMVGAWPAFAGSQIRVVSVAHVPALLSAGVPPTMLTSVRHARAEDLARSRLEHERRARRTALWLRASGLAADHELREGDPGATLLAAAREFSADLIVVGTRGASGVRRLLLGSVARNVLLHAPSSVLVVRPQR